MCTSRHLKFPLLAAAAALAAGALLFPVSAGAVDGHDSMPGMTAEQHAQMSGNEHDSMPGMTADEHAQMSGNEHDSMPGMTAEEHAQMSGNEHDSMPGTTADHHVQMSGHGHGESAAKRPVWLVLGGFAFINALVLVYALVIRRRPAAVKRRETLARVRSASSAPTAPSTPAADAQS